MSSGKSLPHGWAKTTSGELFTYITSGSRGWARHYADKGAKFIRVGNLSHHTTALDLYDVQHVQPPDGPEARRTRILAGDLLISVTADVGMVGLVPEGLGEAYVNQHVAIARPSEEIDNRYLAWFLSSEHGGQRQFKALQRGATKAGLGLDDLRAIEVLLPCLSEQRRIVAKIDELLSDLDTGVAALKRAQANLKRYRAAVLRAAVTGELTAEWRKAHPDIEPASKLLDRILAERRRQWEAEQEAKFKAAGKVPPKNWQAKYSEPRPPEGGLLPELPVGWCWATIEQVSQFTKYGSSAKTNLDSSGVPVARMGNIKDGLLVMDDVKYLPHDHPEFPDLLLEPGDLLFNRTNSAELVGKTAVYRGQPSPCSYASYLIAVRFLRGFSPDLAAYYINSALGKVWLKSVMSQQCGQANVNGTKLQALAIPLPPLAEQETIIAEVEQRLSVIASAEATIAANLKRASRLRQSILKEAFAGRLVPQDPADEPAAVLLARLRQAGAGGDDKMALRKPQGRAGLRRAVRPRVADEEEGGP
jgi:type I restriction enzyme S subunit